MHINLMQLLPVLLEWKIVSFPLRVLINIVVLMLPWINFSSHFVSVDCVTLPVLQISIILTIMVIDLIEIIKILGQRQKGVIARSILFRPGGPLASELARHPVVLKVNDWVFCHGGLLPHHGKIENMWIYGITGLYLVVELSFNHCILYTIAVAYGLERMNREVSDWMSGLNVTDDYSSLPFIATRGYDSVVWNRLYSRDVSDLDDYQLIQVSWSL